MDLPGGLEELPDVVVREVVGSPVRSVENRDLPAFPDLRKNAFRRNKGKGGFPVPDMKNVSGSQSASAMSAESAERERRTAPQIFRNVDSAGNGEIAALAAAGDADFQRVALLRLHRNVPTDLPAVQRRGKVAAGEGEERIGVEAERAPERVISRPGASDALPTIRFARRKLYASIGPDGGTPTAQ